MNLQTINPYIRFARIKERTIPQGVSRAVDHRIFYCHSGRVIISGSEPTQYAFEHHLYAV